MAYNAIKEIMDEVSVEQIRRFRLHAHHLDTYYKKADIEDAAGACGFQNSPPGAWEIALHNRIPGLKRDDMKRMLETERMLLQAWSFRARRWSFRPRRAMRSCRRLFPNRMNRWYMFKGYNWRLIFYRSWSKKAHDLDRGMKCSTLSDNPPKDISERHMATSSNRSLMTPSVLPGDAGPL